MNHDNKPAAAYYHGPDRDERLLSQRAPVVALEELARQLEADAGVPSQSTDDIRVGYSRAKLRQMAAVILAALAASCGTLEPHRTHTTDPELIARFRAAWSVCARTVVPDVRVCGWARDVPTYAECAREMQHRCMHAQGYEEVEPRVWRITREGLRMLDIAREVMR